ncbi:MAG: hypothetical protein Q4A82_03580 [Corynebacterium sp.]|nr:hypothetical protein [Corynebacterium sp.]
MIYVCAPKDVEAVHHQQQERLRAIKDAGYEVISDVDDGIADIFSTWSAEAEYADYPVFVFHVIVHAGPQEHSTSSTIAKLLLLNPLCAAAPDIITSHIEVVQKDPVNN